MRAALATAAFLAVGCVSVQSPSEAPGPEAVVAYAVRHSPKLVPPGCTGIEVADGLVVTAKHCLNAAAAVGDNFGAEASPGKVAFISPDHDFTVIAYPTPFYSHPRQFIKMRPGRLGEHVYVVGYPVQLRSGEQELTITEGIVAGPADSDGDARITADAYFGNSGGGVWADDGALLGVLVSINAMPGLEGAPMPYPAQSYMVPIQVVMKALPHVR